ncbi:MAG: beta-lactamase family protein [Lentisphaerae bacterium]|nr:beta-lactamase family protein [Lentisphaerota bacterium]
MQKRLMRICGILLLTATLTGADVPAQRYSNTIAQATAYITNFMAVQNVAGLSIALAESNNIVWAQGFGYADREAGIPVSTGTVFRIGSVSKVFTTTAVLKLVEDAGVELDAPVTDYIPEFATLPRFTNDPPITVRMLLDHQSGLPGDIFHNMFTTEPMPGVLDWMIAYLRRDYPAYPPLFVSVYCNSGFVLAEGIVRAAAGMPFTDYAQTGVFGPLGMLHSSFLNDRPEINDHLAHPYRNGERVPDEYIGGYGTGGMLSSMPDLIRYLRMVNYDGMLEGVRYLQTNSLAEMTADTSTNCPLNVTTSWLSGLGWDFVRRHELDYAGPA